MSQAARRRLGPEQRRQQLLEVGAATFAEHPYEEVLMEDLAVKAGVSRGLMYHYFASKRELFAAIFQRDIDQLLAASEFDTEMPMADQVRASLDAHLDYFVAHRHNILTANRGALAGDPTVQALISDQLATLRNRMLGVLGQHGHARLVTSVALDGWLAFVRAVCVDWLQGAKLSRDEIRELCFRTLASIFSAEVDLEEPVVSRTNT